MNRNKLIDLREEKNLKSKDLAEVFGVNKSTYSEWENDKIPIPTKRLLELSEYHKINIDYMMKLSPVRKEINPTILNLELIGKRLYEAGKEQGVDVSDNSILYIVLSLFGLGIVNYCLIQNDLNKFADK